MIIFIAGMPRAGSMWTYNVVRSCLSAAGKKVLPQEPPVSEREAINNAVSGPALENEVHCIKTHERLPLDIPNTLYICNYRDVRDAVISYMRFMKCDFEFGLKAARWMMDLTDYYYSAPPDRLLTIHYQAVCVSNSTRLIKEIGRFIGVDVPKKTIKDISQRYQKSRIRNLVDTFGNVELDGNGSLVHEQQSEAFTSARNPDGSFRAYHKSSGFQARHITSTKTEEWKEVLSVAEQNRLMEMTGDWLLRYGFMGQGAAQGENNGDT